MSVDFNMEHFIENAKACKPPYKCPFEECGKIYKTFSGIHQHIQQCSAAETKEKPAEHDDTPRPFFRSPQKDTLIYTESQKAVEFEADGHLHKFSIFDALEMVAKEDYEASLPPEVRINQDKPEEEPQTPVVQKVNSKLFKKKKGTPRFGTPKSSSIKPQNVNRDTKDNENESKDAPPTDKKIIKLPEAVYKIVENYKIADAPALPKEYIKFKEKTLEEMDKDVEYDMDEEDVAWLKIMNDKRSNENMQLITGEQFELLMDRLEKESYFHVQTNGCGNYSAPVDEDAICCVCMDGEATNTNVILFCDLCNLAVHQECYGVPYIPEGQWLCRRCLQSPSRSVECCLCPNRGGAFKQTDDGRWAHVVCGLWIPEVRFANTVFLEPIDSIANIPPARWKLTCRVCRQRGVGACIQCHKNSCYIAFHVTCGLLAGLHMKMETVREPGPNGTSISVRKTACCDSHTPADSDAKPRLDDVAALGICTPKSKHRSPKKANHEQMPLPVLFRGLMNFSPQCPWDKVQKIASLVNIQKKNLFFQRLMAYWTLKRQTRNGVPLIRRLQFAKASKESSQPETPQKNAHHHQDAIEDRSEKIEEDDIKEEEVEDDEEVEEKENENLDTKETVTESKEIKEKKPKRELTQAEKTAAEFKAMLVERKKMRTLRQDLEKVRLLCELIRKREQRKREIVQLNIDIKEMELDPFLVFLRKIFEMLQENDAQDIFADPVDIRDVPDYFDHIKIPMDFSTMRKKLDNMHYVTLDELEEDFNLMVNNCLSYNEKETVFYRAGTKMRDIGGLIIRQARRDMETGENSAGTYVDGVASVGKKEEISDDKLMKEIDEFVNDAGREDMENDDHLKKLLQCSDKATMIHHPVAKIKRQKALRWEIQKLRRKMSLGKNGKSKSGEDDKKDKEEEGPVEEDTSSRRVKEEENTSSRRVSRSKPVEKGEKEKKRGKKRGRSEGDEDEENTKKKRKGGDDEKRDEKDKSSKSIIKSGKLSVGTPAKSPVGVNRRNAVLFTRKKAAASEDKTERKNSESGKNDEDEKTEELGRSLRGRRKSQEEDKAKSKDEFEFQDSEMQSPPPPPKAGKGRKGRSTRKSSKNEDDKSEEKGEKSKHPHPVSTSSFVGGPRFEGGPRNPDDSSFRTYRQHGELDTDGDTDAGGHSDLLATSDSESSSEDEGYAARSAHTIQLEPLDLVWAKCRGYPWYPALIINPKMPRTGYFHNGVPIPVPPMEVLHLAESHTKPHYLILFFDSKRTWQWLPRDKLEPLGVDTELDKVKLIQSKKPGERKAVKKAYEDAIVHRCKVTGQLSILTGEGTDAEGDDGSEKEELEEEKPKPIEKKEKEGNKAKVDEVPEKSKEKAEKKKEKEESNEKAKPERRSRHEDATEKSKERYDRRSKHEDSNEKSKDAKSKDKSDKKGHEKEGKRNK